MRGFDGSMEAVWYFVSGFIMMMLGMYSYEFAKGYRRKLQETKNEYKELDGQRNDIERDHVVYIAAKKKKKRRKKQRSKRSKRRNHNGIHIKTTR